MVAVPRRLVGAGASVGRASYQAGTTPEPDSAFRSEPDADRTDESLFRGEAAVAFPQGDMPGVITGMGCPELRDAVALPVAGWVEALPGQGTEVGEFQFSDGDCGVICVGAVCH